MFRLNPWKEVCKLTFQDVLSWPLLEHVLVEPKRSSPAVGRDAVRTTTFSRKGRVSKGASGRRTLLDLVIVVGALGALPSFARALVGLGLDFKDVGAHGV